MRHTDQGPVHDLLEGIVVVARLVEQVLEISDGPVLWRLDERGEQVDRLDLWVLVVLRQLLGNSDNIQCLVCELCLVVHIESVCMCVGILVEVIRKQ